MRPITLIILFYLLPVVAFGQVGSKPDLKYKPQTLDEAVLQLGKMYDDTTKQKIFAMTEDEFVGNSHLSSGLWMRNNWGLWKGSELSKFFNSIGIFHPDDMSGIILTSYYRQLKGQDRELEKQIKGYQDYWKATTEHLDRLKTDTSYQRQIRQTQDSAEVVRLNEKKLKWSAGKKVSGYMDKRCDFINYFLVRTKVEGNIIEWNNDKLVIKITKYYDEKSKKQLTKCYEISNDVLVVSNYQSFRLEE